MDYGAMADVPEDVVKQYADLTALKYILFIVCTKGKLF